MNDPSKRLSSASEAPIVQPSSGTAESDQLIGSDAFAAMLAGADLGPLNDDEKAALHAMVHRLHGQIVALRAVETTDIEPDIAFVAERPTT